MSSNAIQSTLVMASRDKPAGDMPGGGAGPRPLIAGVYVPTPCFFRPDTEDIDTETITRHVVRLAQAGIVGMAVQGTNGEAVHLNQAERRVVTATTRKALDEAGFGQVPVIVGCGQQSTHGTVELCREAHESGGSYALVLAPSYFAANFAADFRTVVDYFTAVADQSPIPILIYNFPAVTAGIDLTSDVIIELAEHRNIVGVKLTCGNTGKLNRIASAVRAQAGARYNPHTPAFLVLAGSADFTIQSMVGGSHGVLTGLGNVCPRSCVRLFDLFTAYQAGKGGGGGLQEVQAMQEVVARGDWVGIRGGVVGTKAGLQALVGYGGYARHPLPKPSQQELEKIKAMLAEIWKLEESLHSVGGRAPVS